MEKSNTAFEEQVDLRCRRKLCMIEQEKGRKSGKDWAILIMSTVKVRWMFSQS
jgi:hypothetical protein